MLTAGKLPLIWLRKSPCASSLLKFFVCFLIKDRCWIFVKCFSVSIEMIICFIFILTLLCYNYGIIII